MARSTITFGNRRAVAAAGLAALALLGALFAVAPAPASGQSAAVTVTNTSVTPATPTAGETFVVTARVTNAQSASADFDLNQVHIETPRGRSYVARDLGTLAPGTSTTVQIPVRVQEPGSQTLSVRIFGQDGRGFVRTIQHPVPVDIEGNRAARISMAASAADMGPSGRTDLQISVANGFTEAISGVELTVTSDDLTLPESQRITSQMPPGNVTRFTLPARDVQPGPHDVSVTMRYTTAGGDRQTITRNLTAVVSRVSAPGRIRLTEIDVVRERGQLVVRGSASNVGTTDVSGVVVSVEDSPTARPAGGSADFFVGEVPASDFSSFDVSVQPTSNGTVTIPLNVSYVVDGTRTSHVYEVSHDVSSTGGADEPQPQSGGSPLLLIVGALVLVGGLVIGWRRYRR